MTSAPPTSLSLVETDAFCDCGYNLHGQPVWRDEELQILLCRCPECGHHAAAGRFTGIHAAWLHRLSFALIVSWVGFLLGLFIFLTFMLGIWPGGYISDAISWNSVPNTGPNQTQYVYDLVPTSNRDSGRQLWFNVTIYGFATLTGLITGGLAATLLWHLRRRIYLALLLPAVAIAFVLAGWSMDTSVTDRARHWIFTHLTIFAVVEWVAILIGIQIGRPVARFVLQLLLPNRLLQHLAFLWYRDGKSLHLDRNEERGR